MKIIQIRGCNGTGKTTAVREFVNKNNLKIKEITINNLLTHISVSDDNKIVVLGRYDKKSGGCDLYKSNDHVFNTMIWVITNIKPRLVIYEGVIYSTIYKFSVRVAEMAKKYGYKYMSIQLRTAPSTILDRIYKRNGGKKINEKLVFNKIKMVNSAQNKLHLDGYETKTIDTTNIDLNNMYRILEEQKNGR